MKSIKKYGLLIALGIISLGLEISYSEPFVLNSEYEPKFNVDVNVAVGNIDTAKKTMDLKISDLEVAGSEDFELYAMVPGESIKKVTTNSISYNYFKAEFPYPRKVIGAPLKLDFQPNLWPFETYSAKILVVLEGNVSIEYQDLQDHGFFYQSLVNTTEWSAKVDPKLDPHEDLPDLIPTDRDLTILNHEIILSHTNNYKMKNLVYFFLPAILMALVFVHSFFFRNNPRRQFTIFFGAVGFFIASKFSLPQILSSDITLLEILMYSTIFLHLVVFLVVSIRYENRRRAHGLSFWPSRTKNR